ncbi:HD domain-containing protein [Fusibacter sp. JL298sf-3]
MKVFGVKKLFVHLLIYMGIQFLVVMLSIAALIHLIPVRLTTLLTGGVFFVFTSLAAMALYGMMYIQEQERVYGCLGDVTLIDQTYFFKKPVTQYALLKQHLTQTTGFLKALNQALTLEEEKVKVLEETLTSQSVQLESQQGFYASASGTFNAFLKHLDYGFVVIDTSGKIRCMSDSFKRYFEKPPLFIFELMAIDFHGIDLFIKRDIDRIKFHLKLNGKETPVFGRTVRQMKAGEVQHIYLFLEDLPALQAIKDAHYKKSKVINLLYELSLVVSDQNTIQTVLQEALEKLNYVAALEEAGVRLYEPDKGLVLKATNGLKSIESFKRIKSVTQSHAGYAFLNNKMHIINRKSDLLLREAGVLACLEKGQYIAYVPLVSNDKKIGLFSVVTTQPIDENDTVFYESIAIQLTLAIEKIMLIEEVKNNYFKTVEAFVTATEIKSRRFGGHSRRVAELCKIIAERLYFSQSEVDEIYIAGLLHDVGKLAFSDNALDNYVDVHTHGRLGRQMIEKVGLSKMILEGIEHHHMDYNDKAMATMGLKEQPYYAQIIRVCNDLDMFLTYSKREAFYKTFMMEMALFEGEKYAPNFIRILTSMFEDPDNIIFALYDEEVAS